MAYYHTKTKKIQKVHPVIERFSKMYQKQKAFLQRAYKPQPPPPEDRESDLRSITSFVLERVNKHLPPSTPDVIERLAKICNIDTTTEFYLARALKATFEAYIEKQYDLQTIVSDLRDPLEFLREIRKEQVRHEILKKPESVVVCTECEQRAAVYKCLQCRDFFCQGCFNALHATGKRRLHLTNDVEQLVCSVCDLALATCECVQDGLFFCDRCWNAAHSNTQTQTTQAAGGACKYLKRILNGMVCWECEEANATKLCEDCLDLFCTECFMRLHCTGKRRTHSFLTLDNEGNVFRGGIAVAPEEAQRLIDRARSAADSGPWMAFQDESFETYWFHLANKYSTRVSPYDTRTAALPDAVSTTSPQP
mmetsp:Transcript_36242/g.90471  ORF Transcript_36242/g.90471 Transcript_36242/m.90471 type:complete len:365 (-) Transcript_36242:64-1158(-)